MISGPLKSKIDKLWEMFWSGGITNPLSVIEQISYLMFVRMLDIRETRNEKRANRLKQTYQGIYSPQEQHLRWSHLKHVTDGEQLLRIVRDEVFPGFKRIAVEGSTFGEYMKDAMLLILKPSLLISAIEKIDELPLADDDAKGDLYEYLLSKLTTAGIAGQFRTPRHIIKLMVHMLDPKPDERIADPACGTAGFLVAVMHYLQEKYTSPQGIYKDEDNNTVYSGDLLEPFRNHIQQGLLHGFDFDASMLRIAAMNLMLHGIDAPDIHYQDSLGTNFHERFPQQSEDCFDVILANPPFKGTIDEDDLDPTLTGQVKTKKTELLFISLMLRMLKLGGRCATIVPDGVLFGSSKAHLALRKRLIEENQLEGIVSLPAGVFKPYAGVSTAILLFSKGGRTDHVWFYDVQNDGFSLDDKRTETPDKNDLPDVLETWRNRDPGRDIDRTKKNFYVPIEKIRELNFELSISRYKQEIYTEEKYENPKNILAKIKKLESQIIEDINELEQLV